MRVPGVLCRSCHTRVPRRGFGDSLGWTDVIPSLQGPAAALGLCETRMFQNLKAEDCCVLETRRRQGDEGDVPDLGPCDLYEVLSVLEI